LPPNALGKTVQCPRCSGTFVAQLPGPVDEGITDRPGRQAPPQSEPVEELPQLEEIEESAVGSPTGDFAPIHFAVIVRADTEKTLPPRCQGRLTPQGLILTRGQKRLLEAPVGTPTVHLGRNRVQLTLPGERTVKLSLVKHPSTARRLAKDAAAFLNGNRTELRKRDYALPWYVYLPVPLSLGIAVIGIAAQVLIGGVAGGLFWGALAGGLAGACLYITVRQQETEIPRFVLSLGLAAAGYLVLPVAFAADYWTSGRRISASDWKEFSPPGEGFRILMPGRPAASNPPMIGAPGTYRSYRVELGSGDAEFIVGCADIPREQLPTVPLDQRFVGAREGMLSNSPPGCKLTDEREISLDGYPGRQFVLRVPFQGQYVTRLYIVDTRLYMLLAGGSWIKPDKGDAQKFFDSFALESVPKPAPPPAKSPADQQRGNPPAVAQPPAPSLPRPPSTPPPATDFAGLLAYWNFDEGNGEKAADLSEHKNAAAVHDGEWTPGIRGKAVHLSGCKRLGGSEGYVDLGEAAHLNFAAGAPFTYSVWVKTSAASGTILAQRNSSNESSVIDLTFSVGHLIADVRDDANLFGRHARINGGAINDDAWHHIALARTDGGKSVELFLDGVSQGQSSAPQAGGTITTDWRCVGMERFWNKKGTETDEARYLNGTVDEVCVFDRALSVEEIRKLAGQ
jgi:hypothetical protein